MTGIDYRLLLESFQDAVVVCDGSHCIQYANAAAERLLLWPVEELVGKPATTIIPQRLHAEHREGFKRYLATRKARIVGQTVRVPAVRKDGSEVEVELTLNAAHSGDDDLIIASLRDVGDRVGLERQLTVMRYLRATTQAAARLSSGLDLDQMLSLIVETMVADFDSALARVWIHEPATGTLHLRASAGLSRETVVSRRAQLDLAGSSDKISQAARTRQPLVIHDLSRDPDFDPAWVERERLASAAIFPLLSGGELRGVLAHFTRRPLREEFVEALGAFVAIVTAAIADAQLFAREQAARVEAEDQRQKLQTILDLLPVGVLLAEGPEGTVTVVNPAGQEIWGDLRTTVTLEELDRIFPLAPMDAPPQSIEQRPLWRALHQGERVREILRFRRPDGQEGVVDVMAAPFPGPKGGAVATFRDVTSRLRMESELAERAAQFKALLDYLPVGVAYFDDQCVCRASNGPALRILGRSRGEIAGVPTRELFAQAPALCSAVERCVREQQPHAEQASPWPDPGEPEGLRHLDWRFEPLPKNPPRFPGGALALIVDVTERKRAQDELLLAKEAAEQAARNKTRFLSAVSHDLRTPVNALSLLAELLGHVVEQRDDPGGELRGVTADIRQACANLIELINDLLDLARFDSGDIEHHPTDFALGDWMSATLEPLRLTAESKGLSLSWKVEPSASTVHADRVKLSRVLTNLVGNAVKFTESGSVRVHAGATSEGWLALTVSDTGPGIPADQLDRIFDEFAQLRNPERDRTKGTGLGLAICKRLVGAVGGRLTVSSQLGRGSTFTAFYPPDHVLGAPSTGHEGTEPAGHIRVASRAPILLVEDDPRSRQALSRLLARVGYVVEPVGTGDEALDALDKVHPALVLLDLMLPGMSGAEVLRHIRTRPEWRALPVVLLSGDILNGNREELEGLDVADVLAKPVDFDALLAVIARHVQTPPLSA